ncbi:MAG: DUF4241 domain-containing protein [bacterium]
MGSADPEDWAAISQWVNAKDRFFAMQSGARVPIGARWASLSVHELGSLTLTSGQLGACDPFVFLDGCPSFVEVEPGTYPVFVTIADIEGDAPDWVEAYVTLRLDPDATEVRHERLDEGFGVDAGTACFVDAQAAAEAMAGDHDWESVVEGPGGWFERVDDPQHFRPGLANVCLPGQPNANIVLCHSGWGDGFYDVVLGYDAHDRLVNVHIDFAVVHAPRAHNVDANPRPTQKTKMLAMALSMSGAAVLFAVGMAMKWSAEAVVFSILGWIAATTVFSIRKGWTSI